MMSILRRIAINFGSLTNPEAAATAIADSCGMRYKYLIHLSSILYVSNSLKAKEMQQYQLIAY